MTTTQQQKRQAPAPSGASATAVGSGGTFTAGAQFWKITALVAGLGESAPSAEVTQSIALNGSCNLAWTCPAGTTAVRIYRGTVTNTENVLVGQLQGAPTSYTDTGSSAGAGTPPAASSWAATSKGGTPVQPTKANIPAGLPAGLAQAFYSGSIGWQNGVNANGSASVEARNRKYVQAAGWDLQEV